MSCSCYPDHSIIRGGARYRLHLSSALKRFSLYQMSLLRSTLFQVENLLCTSPTASSSTRRKTDLLPEKKQLKLELAWFFGISVRRITHILPRCCISKRIKLKLGHHILILQATRFGRNIVPDPGSYKAETSRYSLKVV